VALHCIALHCSVSVNVSESVSAREDECEAANRRRPKLQTRCFRQRANTGPMEGVDAQTVSRNNNIHPCYVPTLVRRVHGV